MADPLHVVSLNDLREHTCDGACCPCQPKILENGPLIVHNSWDGREILEVAEVMAFSNAGRN